MIANSITSYGIAAALDQIKRALFEEAEARLAEKMKPARLAPLAASDAVIEELLQSPIESRQSEIS